MGAYNLLHVSDVKCDRCGRVGDRRIQFKYGSWRADEYEIGDTLNWVWPYKGIPGLTKVVVVGVTLQCPICGYDPDDYYDIFICRDAIASATKSSGRYDYDANGWIAIEE